MGEKTSRKTKPSESSKGYFLTLVKSVKKKIKQKVLRRKRFLRMW